jgi:hypothetical protein
MGDIEMQGRLPRGTPILTTQDTRTMAEHTNLPWHINDDAPACIVGASNRAVAICRLSPTNQEDRANAAFIVKACNSHAANESKIDALVKALEYIIKDAPESEPDAGDYDSSNHGDSFNYGSNSLHWSLAKAAREALALCDKGGGSRG